MKDYVTQKERMERLVQKDVPRKKRGKLAKIVLAGMLVAGVGIGSYGIVSDYIKEGEKIRLETETPVERRARLLNLAEDQLSHLKNPKDIQGLKAYIQEIKNGVYDYSK